MLWHEQQKIYNTKIIESAKLIEQICHIKIPFIRLIARCDIYVTTISCFISVCSRNVLNIGYVIKT